MENMSFSFIAKKLVIWFSLVLLIVALGMYVHREIFTDNLAIFLYLNVHISIKDHSSTMKYIDCDKIICFLSVSAIREKGTIGECFGKCADLGIDCDELCKDSGFPGGGCIPIQKDCCCVYG